MYSSKYGPIRQKFPEVLLDIKFFLRVPGSYPEEQWYVGLMNAVLISILSRVPLKNPQGCGKKSFIQYCMSGVSED